MSFRTLLAQAHATTAGVFGESITYTPAGGAPRQIIAVVGSSVETEQHETGLDQQTERITVRVDRDEITGINAPAIGDKVNRDAANEPDSRPYVYANEIAGKSADKWSLVFWRYRIAGQGVKG